MGSSEDPSLINNVDELGLVYWGLTLKKNSKFCPRGVYTCFKQFCHGFPKQQKPSDFCNRYTAFLRSRKLILKYSDKVRASKVTGSFRKTWKSSCSRLTTESIAFHTRCWRSAILAIAPTCSDKLLRPTATANLLLQRKLSGDNIKI